MYQSPSRTNDICVSFLNNLGVFLGVGPNRFLYDTFYCKYDTHSSLNDSFGVLPHASSGMQSFERTCCIFDTDIL